MENKPYILYKGKKAYDGGVFTCLKVSTETRVASMG